MLNDELLMDIEKLDYFGQVVSFFRHQKGFTQALLAEQSEISVRSLQKIENGDVFLPRSDTLKRIYEALNLSEDESKLWHEARIYILNQKNISVSAGVENDIEDISHQDVDTLQIHSNNVDHNSIRVLQKNVFFLIIGFGFILISGFVFASRQKVELSPVLMKLEKDIMEITAIMRPPAIPCPTNANMVLIPSGDVIIGSSQEEIEMFRSLEEGLCDNCFTDELERRTVYVEAFCIGKHEVTNAEFEQFIEETGYVTTAEKDGHAVTVDPQNVYEGVEGVSWRTPNGIRNTIERKENHPVVHVTYSDAVAYCNWIDGRLPTNNEWEKAARGPYGFIYPWGNEFVQDSTNYNKIKNGTMPIGSYQNDVSFYGVFDTAGNVQEWVGDDYPYEADKRYRRGGSWWNTMTFLHSAWLSNPASYKASPVAGIRCVVDIE